MLKRYIYHQADPYRGEGTELLPSTPPIRRSPQIFFSYWFPPIFWGLAILAMSGDWGSGKNTLHLLRWFLSPFASLSLPQLQTINFYTRKTGHLLAYGWLYFLWFRAFRASVDYTPWRACRWSLGFCLLFASLDEGRQCFYPSRGASLRDVFLDLAGAGLGGLITAAVGPPPAPALSRPRNTEGQRD